MVHKWVAKCEPGENPNPCDSFESPKSANADAITSGFTVYNPILRESRTAPKMEGEISTAAPENMNICLAGMAE